MARKIFTRATAKLFFLTGFPEILFSSLVSFAYFDSCFFVCLVVFEIKNVYSDLHSTIRAGE